MRKISVRISALLLMLALIAVSLPLGGAVAAKEDVIYVIAGSDFQEGSHEGSAQNVRSILNQMKNDGIDGVYGLLFCGDYVRNYSGSSTESKLGLDTLNATVKEVFPTVESSVCIKGNHDPRVAGIAESGNNDTPYYGVFVINEDDFMQYGGNSARVRQTADNLRAYLEEKEEECYTKPIFVLSHLPLHYTSRVKQEGDGVDAYMIFDELNEAAAMGLNIVFMHGHDHSNGWDNYMGGTADFLKPGDTVMVATGSRSAHEIKTLNFYYMNAGYTGYYDDPNGADDTLNMSVFAITGGTMTVSRYSADGIHNLKSAGTYNSKYDDSSVVEPNLTVYESPQTFELSQSIVAKTVVTDEALGVTVKAVADAIDIFAVTGGAVAQKFGNADNYSGCKAFAAAGSGLNISKKATFSVDLDGMSSALIRVYRYDGSYFERVQITGVLDGTVTFDGTLPGTYVVAECVANVTGYSRITSVSELETGDGYILMPAKRDGSAWFYMIPEVKTVTDSKTRTGFDIVSTNNAGADTISENISAYEWTLTKVEGGFLLSHGGKYAKLTSTANAGITATLEDEGTVFAITGGTTYNFTDKDTGYVFNYNDRALINGYASEPANFYIYKFGAAAIAEDEQPASIDVTNNPELARSVGVGYTSVSNYDDSHKPDVAFDNDDSTYWQANSADKTGAWLTVELDGVYEVGAVVIRWHSFTANRSAVIEVSLDGESWTQVASGIGDPDLKSADEVVIFTPVQARFVKYYSTDIDSGKDLAPEISEIMIYRGNPYFETVTAVAAQQKVEDGVRTVRFISAVNAEFKGGFSADYSEIGFEVTAVDASHGEMSEFTVSDNLVYDAVETYGGAVITGESFDLEGGKIFMLTVTNVESDVLFYVRAFAVNAEGEVVYGNNVSPTAVSFVNGEIFAD